MSENTLVLQDRLDELHHRISALEQRLQDTPDYGLGRGDPRVADWEMAKALLAKAREDVTSTEEALAWACSGHYGVCESCGALINPDRIAVLPATRLCVACARKAA